MIGSSSAKAVVGRVLTPTARALHRAGVTPDMVTIIGTLGVVGMSLGFLSTGHFALGPWLVTIFIFSDTIDGVLARLQGSSGPWGAFLDSSLDRFGDAAIFGSFVIWYAGGGDSRLISGVALFVLAAGSITSYLKARAEGLGLTANVGIAERAERLIIGLVACGLDGMLGVHWILPAGLWVLAVLTAVTVAQRFVVVWRQARAPAAHSAAVPPARVP